MLVHSSAERSCIAVLAHTHQCTGDTSRPDVLPLVDAGVEDALTLFGSTLTTGRLLPITLPRNMVSTSGMYKQGLFTRTLILLLRHAAHAVETWWREPAMDFSESDIASDFCFHRLSSFHRYLDIGHQILQCMVAEIRMKTGVVVSSRVLRRRARLGGVGVSLF